VEGLPCSFSNNDRRPFGSLLVYSDCHEVAKTSRRGSWSGFFIEGNPGNRVDFFRDSSACFKFGKENEKHARAGIKRNNRTIMNHE